MLSTLMVLAATATVQTGSVARWQDDPHDPWIIGPWTLTCRRDGNFTGWNLVEGCGANAYVGKVRLVIARTATEAHTGFSVNGCDSRSGDVDLSLRVLNTPGAPRVRLVRDALRRTIKAAVDHCAAGSALKGFTVRDRDIAAILEGSDGLEDETRPAS